MKKIMGQIEKEFGRKDFLYIINTHGDYDHCSGNQIFPDARIIGQEMCPGYMKHFPANTPQAIRRLRQDISDMKKNLKNKETDIQDLTVLREKTEACTLMLESIENDYRVTPPSVTFKDSLSLKLDDLTVRMFYCGKAHTDNDIMIYIPEEKLVFTGDLFNSKYNFGFSVNKTDDAPRLINLMNKILRDPSGLEYVIRGHGEYLSGKDFASLRDLLAEQSFRK
jgi:glyoxylase-like metal-dependent hydrolase (beta-lactamase superfamily II)